MNLQDCLDRLDSTLDALRPTLACADSRPHALSDAKKEIENLAEQNPQWASEIRKHGQLRLFLEATGAQNQKEKASPALRANVRAALEKDAATTSFWSKWGVLAPKLAWGGGLAATGAFLLLVAMPIVNEQARTPLVSMANDAASQSSPEIAPNARALEQSAPDLAPATAPKTPIAKSAPRQKAASKTPQRADSSHRPDSNQKLAEPSKIVSGIAKTDSGVPKNVAGAPSKASGIAKTASGIAKIASGAPSNDIGLAKTPSGTAKIRSGALKRASETAKTPSETAPNLSAPVQKAPALPAKSAVPPMGPRALKNRQENARPALPPPQIPASPAPQPQPIAPPAATFGGAADSNSNEAASFQISVSALSNALQNRENASVNSARRDKNAARENAPASNGESLNEADELKKQNAQNFRARANAGRLDGVKIVAPRVFQFRFSSEIALQNVQICLNLPSANVQIYTNQAPKTSAPQILWSGDLAPQTPVEAEFSLAVAPGSLLQAVLEQKSANGESKTLVTQNLAAP